jgi:hypothetical protein
LTYSSKKEFEGYHYTITSATEETMCPKVPSSKVAPVQNARELKYS